MRAYRRARLLRASLGAGRDWAGVRILGYHRIADDRHSLCVRPARFRKQMAMVLDHGYEPIALGRALDLLDAGPVPARHVAVTFDDAYLDNLRHAVPILRDLGIPATIFVPTRIVDGTASYWWFEGEQPPALDWASIRELDREGLVSFGAHTLTHPFLPRVDDATAREEVLVGRTELEERLGHAVETFCFPAGLYEERELKLVREAGYRAALTTTPGVNTHDTPRLELRRTLVYSADGPPVYAAKIDGRLDRPPALRDRYYRRRARR
jgi:peptidoglycan/xylan/chitin deacetylase (PgdA/CDA1 family)